MDIPDIPAFESTFQGYHCWSKAKFEKLGWMLLAKRDGHDSKLRAYFDSLKHLCADLKARIELTQEQDRKIDLMILHRNSEFLLENAERILNSPSIAKSSKKRSMTRHSSKKSVHSSKKSVHSSKKSVHSSKKSVHSSKKSVHSSKKSKTSQQKKKTGEKKKSGLLSFL
jgi:hypothetical protein